MSRFVTAAAILALVAACSPQTKTNTGTDADQFLKTNASNPEALQDKFGSDAEAACSLGADDYLRSIAAHDFAWDDDAKGFLGIKFGKYSKISAGPHLLTVVSEKAKVSNNFGAFSHISLYCVYDVSGKKVVSFSIVDPGIAVANATAEASTPTPAQGQAGSDEPPEPNLPSSATARDKRDMREWLRLETLCRGSSDGATIDRECPRRDNLGVALEERGWCWAYSDINVLPPDYDWHRCSVERPQSYDAQDNSDESG